MDGKFGEPNLFYRDTSVVQSSSTLYLKSSDMNNDGYFDLILHTSFAELVNYPICIFNNHEGEFRSEPDKRLYHPSYDVNGLAIVDVNSDNMLDIFITIDTHSYFGKPILGYISENDSLPEIYNWNGEEELDGMLFTIDFNNDSLEEFWARKIFYSDMEYHANCDFYLNENNEMNTKPTFTINSFLVGHKDLNNDYYNEIFSPNEIFLNNSGEIKSKPLWINNSSLQGPEEYSIWGDAKFGKFTQTTYSDFISLKHFDSDNTTLQVFKQYPDDSTSPKAPVIESVKWDEYEAKIHLNWEIPSDEDIQGFAIYYTLDTDDSLMMGKGLEQGDSPVIIAIQDSILLSGVIPDTTYWFAIAAIDKGGWRSAVSNLVLCHICIVI